MCYARVGQPEHVTPQGIVEQSRRAKAAQPFDKDAERNPERERDPALVKQSGDGR